MNHPEKHFAIQRVDGLYRNTQHGWNRNLFKENPGDVGTRFWKNLQAAFDYGDSLNESYGIVDANGKVQTRPGW